MSAIDLALVSPTVATRLSWFVTDDLHQSDHFPTLISIDTTQVRTTQPPRWLTHKADWKKFAHHIVCHPLTGDTERDVQGFTESITAAAEASIPQRQPFLHRRKVPWWNAECSSANTAKKQAFRIFRRFPTEENRINFKRLRAFERKTFLTAQRSTFREFTSTITSSTPIRQVWNKIKTVSGKYTPYRPPSLLQNGVCHTDPSIVADIFADGFAGVSASESYDARFLAQKEAQEEMNLNFEEDELASYSSLFTMLELERVLEHRAETAPGQDRVTFSMLQHLPPSGKSHLLKLFNQIWITNTYPKCWQKSIVVAIHKEGKDPSLHSSYRPISLTSCMSKTMEAMVNFRLVWVLESQGLLSSSQAGFRQHHSTTDQLVFLDYHIQRAFHNRQHAIAVFFDLEKAYDMTWRYGILMQLSQWGIRGRLPLFVQGFLRHREFQVRVGSVLSQPRVQENGIPQGSVLSVTLFGIAVNALSTAIPPSIEQTLYVDDLCILITGFNIQTMGETMQHALNSLSEIALKRGFKFSATKTSCIHFCRLRHPHEAPILQLDGAVLQYTQSVKFLGLHLDCALRWSVHCQHVQNKALKPLNILRLLAGHTWGADTTILLRLYRSLLCSKLEYGVEVYSSARPTHLRRIDRIYNQGIRIVLGAYRTSPVISMYSLAGELPPDERRILSCLSYGVRLSATPTNRLNALFYPIEDGNTPPSAIPRSFPGRFKKYTHDLEISYPPISSRLIPPTPPWTYRVEVIHDLSQFVKGDTHPQIYEVELRRVLDQFRNACIYYTDGSRTAEGVGCAVYSDEILELWPLPPPASVYTAELTAIRKAIQMHIRSSKNLDAVICTDSLSAMLAIENIFSLDPHVVEIHERIQVLYDGGSRCVIVWIPGHINIVGNEAADYGAKRATSLQPPADPAGVRWNDVRNLLRHSVRAHWQSKWTDSHSKLRDIKPRIEPWLQNSLPRRDAVAVARLRIGHTRLTHSYLLLSRPPPNCPLCGVRVTAVHLLLECPQITRLLLDANVNFPRNIQSLLGNNSPHLELLLFTLRRVGILAEL